MTCSGCLEQNPHSILTRLISLPHPALIPLITQQLIFHLMVPASALPSWHTASTPPTKRSSPPWPPRSSTGRRSAHCPESNTDIASGIAPVRRYLDMGLHVGLGTDVAGGFSLSMFRAMADAIQVSKLRWRLMDQTQAPVTLEEAFYMATIGGGSFFGKVGSFEKGYEFDAMILDDSNIRHPQEISTRDRLERLVYLSDDRNLVGKYVQGRKVI